MGCLQGVRREAAARTAAVVAASAGSLGYEILLVRLFGIEHFHHFAAMAIGVAMLGWAAAGTLHALARRSPDPTVPLWAALATSAALAIAPALAHALPFDPTQLAWDLRQWGWLALLELILAVPFAAAAATVLGGLALEPERPGRLYGASFLGAALGVAAALGALAVLDPVRAVCIPAALAGIGAATAALLVRARALRAWALVTVLATLGFVARPPWTLELVPYKSLPQVEAYPDARRVAERQHPVGWMVAVESSAFRHAPGLSLSYEGEFPRQVALFVDGQLVGSAPAAAETSTAVLAYLKSLPAALPYALGAKRRVLVVGAGGSTEVELAAAHGAREVTALELHAAIAELAARGASARARWVVGDARSFLARARTRYDLITLGPGGGPGTAAAGVHALSEDYLHTTDAYVAYLKGLAPGGVLAVTRWLTVPPRSPVRVILTAGEALRRTGVRDPRSGLAIGHSWGTVTVLAKPSGFGQGDVRALEIWAAERRFDLDWAPGLGRRDTPWNVIGEPILEDAVRATADAGATRRFAADYPFRVEPVSDAQPYPHHFIGWRALPRLLGGDRGSWLPFAEWGTLTLAATLAQAVAFGGALLLLPLAGAGRRRASDAPLPDRTPRVAALVFFGAIGFAYLAAEIAAIQQLGLLLGHPVYAVAAALAAFLIFSGIGSLAAERIAHTRVSAWLVVLAGLLVLEALALLPLVHAFQPAPLGLRAAVALVALAPPALLMGLPFPIGLRALAHPPLGLAWAWAANGVASVITAPLAALIALESGTRALFVLAALAYLAAAVVLARAQATARAGPAAT